MVYWLLSSTVGGVSVAKILLWWSSSFTFWRTSLRNAHAYLFIYLLPILLKHHWLQVSVTVQLDKSIEKSEPDHTDGLHSSHWIPSRGKRSRAVLDRKLPCCKRTIWERMKPGTHRPIRVPHHTAVANSSLDIIHVAIFNNICHMKNTFKSEEWIQPRNLKKKENDPRYAVDL